MRLRLLPLLIVVAGLPAQAVQIVQQGQGRITAGLRASIAPGQSNDVVIQTLANVAPFDGQLGTLNFVTLSASGPASLDFRFGFASLVSPPSPISASESLRQELTVGFAAAGTVVTSAVAPRTMQSGCTVAVNTSICVAPRLTDSFAVALQLTGLPGSTLHGLVAGGAGPPQLVFQAQQVYATDAITTPGFYVGRLPDDSHARGVWDYAWTLTYDYTPTVVPEPAVAALWAGGLLMLAALGHRRRHTG